MCFNDKLSQDSQLIQQIKKQILTIRYNKKMSHKSTETATSVSVTLKLIFFDLTVQILVFTQPLNWLAADN